MKKTLLSMAISAQLVFSTGIPVVDAVANAQAIGQNIKEGLQWAEQAKRWATSIIHYEDQLKAYKDDLISQTGIKDSVQFIKDLKNFDEYSRSYNIDLMGIDNDILKSNSPIGKRANELFNQYNIFDDCDVKYFGEKEKDICRNKVIRRVQEIAVYQEFNESLNQSSENLNRLSEKLISTQDIKESQDIGNAIQVEIAKLNVTKSQVELMNAQNTRLDKIEEKQKEQLIKQTRGKSADYRELRN